MMVRIMVLILFSVEDLVGVVMLLKMEFNMIMISVSGGMIVRRVEMIFCLCDVLEFFGMVGVVFGFRWVRIRM